MDGMPLPLLERGRRDRGPNSYSVTGWKFTTSDTTCGTTFRDLAGCEHQAAAEVHLVQAVSQFSFGNNTVRLAADPYPCNLQEQNLPAMSCSIILLNSSRRQLP
ncbi:hypothetical protein WJX82_004697 [Trebouxia sp. C0006]